MKYSPLAALVVILWSCTSEKTYSYEEGIKNCSEQRDSIQSINKHIGVAYSKNCLVGFQLPKFQSKTISGKVIDENYFNGKAGIINFWFEGCPPCVKEIPLLNRIIESTGREDLFYLAVGRDSKEDISIFLQSHPWEYDQVEDGKHLIESVFKFPYGYPTSFIVNKKGIITKVTGGITETNFQEILNIIKSAAQ